MLSLGLRSLCVTIGNRLFVVEMEKEKSSIGQREIDLCEEANVARGRGEEPNNNNNTGHEDMILAMTSVQVFASSSTTPSTSICNKSDAEREGKEEDMQASSHLAQVAEFYVWTGDAGGFICVWRTKGSLLTTPMWECTVTASRNDEYDAPPAAIGGELNEIGEQEAEKRESET